MTGLLEELGYQCEDLTHIRNMFQALNLNVNCPVMNFKDKMDETSITISAMK